MFIKTILKTLTVLFILIPATRLTIPRRFNIETSGYQSPGSHLLAHRYPPANHIPRYRPNIYQSVQTPSTQQPVTNIPLQTTTQPTQQTTVQPITTTQTTPPTTPATLLSAILQLTASPRVNGNAANVGERQVPATPVSLATLPETSIKQQQATTQPPTMDEQHTAASIFLQIITGQSRRGAGSQTSEMQRMTPTAQLISSPGLNCYTIVIVVVDPKSNEPESLATLPLISNNQKPVVAQLLTTDQPETAMGSLQIKTRQLRTTGPTQAPGMLPYTVKTQSEIPLRATIGRQPYPRATRLNLLATDVPTPRYSGSTTPQSFDLDSVKYNVTEVLTKERFDDARQELEDLFLTNEDLIPNYVELPFHDCVGGCDGCLDGQNLINSGAIDTYSIAISRHHRHKSYMSLSDYIALAGTEAVKAGARKADCYGSPCSIDMGEFMVGRGTCREPNNPPGRTIPRGDDITAIDFLKDEFNLTTRDAVALLGAHTLGEAHAENQGFHGPWDTTPLALDINYYKGMSRFNDWKIEPVNNGTTFQWRGGFGTSQMLHPDMILFKNFTLDNNHRPNCEFHDCPLSHTSDLVREFSHRILGWQRAFAAAFNKMISKTSQNLTPVSELPLY